MQKETLDHLRSKKGPVTRTVPILTDYDVGDEWDRRTTELSKWETRMAMAPANISVEAELDKARKAVNDYRATLKQHTIVFKFRSIGRKRNEKLRMEHPPSDEDVAEFQEQAGDQKVDRSMLFNPDTYPNALIAATMVEPAGLTKEEILSWLEDDSWNEMELSALFQAAMEANTTRKIVELGKG